ncbi:unnamed protein product [Amoebophrya sp. A120]|nr:unnamed protein product [Amoebophrya sp. A120]|eukprot:GSA120T00010996001.1
MEINEEPPPVGASGERLTKGQKKKQRQKVFRAGKAEYVSPRYTVEDVERLCAPCLSTVLPDFAPRSSSCGGTSTIKPASSSSTSSCSKTTSTFAPSGRSISTGVATEIPPNQSTSSPCFTGCFLRSLYGVFPPPEKLLDGDAAEFRLLPSVRWAVLQRAAGPSSLDELVERLQRLLADTAPTLVEDARRFPGLVRKVARKNFSAAAPNVPRGSSRRPDFSSTTHNSADPAAPAFRSTARDYLATLVLLEIPVGVRHWKNPPGTQAAAGILGVQTTTGTILEGRTACSLQHGDQEDACSVDFFSFKSCYLNWLRDGRIHELVCEYQLSTSTRNTGISTSVVLPPGCTTTADRNGATPVAGSTTAPAGEPSSGLVSTPLTATVHIGFGEGVAAQQQAAASPVVPMVGGGGASSSSTSTTARSSGERGTSRGRGNEPPAGAAAASSAASPIHAPAPTTASSASTWCCGDTTVRAQSDSLCTFSLGPDQVWVSAGREFTEPFTQAFLETHRATKARLAERREQLVPQKLLFWLGEGENYNQEGTGFGISFGGLLSQEDHAILAAVEENSNYAASSSSYNSLQQVDHAVAIAMEQDMAINADVGQGSCLQDDELLSLDSESSKNMEDFSDMDESPSSR